VTAEVQIAIIAQIGTFAAVVFNGLVARRQAAQIKNDLGRATSINSDKMDGQDRALAGLQSTASETRVLVNSATRRLLNNVAILSRRLYEINKTDENLAMAEAAEKALFDHDFNQAILEGPGKDRSEEDK